ncbi:MAG TPA: histidinol-phosphatase HisJ family protein [Clostridiales bacterium]|nr:MAG: Histidinol-phosphatase [Firmicutes bacterium ADurb.Bin262]HQH63978.1 histidinol-phosphatase HisJ family protein [Clostridiales bacterium]HQK73902.1 histidinol-phosphatase HisJ family protein [Clostridiales bacterium]
MKYRKVLDTHVHTDNSFDGHHSATFICECAELNGLRGVVFTDHIEIDAYLERHFDRTAVQSYFSIVKARSAFTGRVIAGAGIELGQPVYDIETADKVARALKYDQIIASIHNPRGRPDYSYLDYTQEDVDALLKEYFGEVLATARWNGFDTLGHLTYPLRYICGDYGMEVDLERYSGQIDAILETLVANQKALEINTSGLRQKLGDTMPGEQIVARFRRLGGEYITIGSDAHYASDLAKGVEEGMDMALRCGFECVTLYQKREPCLIPIE